MWTWTTVFGNGEGYCLLSSSAPALLCSNLLIQHSKFQFRNKRSRADAKISVHHHHHPPPPPPTHNFLKLIKWVAFVYCQAWLLLIFAQNSKFHSQSLNSETKGAELTLKSQSTTTHHHHHPPTTHNFLKLVERWFSLSFSSQTIQKIFSISHFQFSKFPNSWRLEILSKLPLFELDSKVALTRIHSIHWKLNDCDGVVGMTKIGMKKIVMMKEWGEWVHHRWIGSAAWLLEFAIVYLYQNFHYSPL